MISKRLQIEAVDIINRIGWNPIGKQVDRWSANELSYARYLWRRCTDEGRAYGDVRTEEIAQRACQEG